MVNIKVYEATTYRVEADTLEQALSSFLDSPEVWISSVDGRRILIAEDNGYRPLTEEEEALAEELGA